MEEFSRSDFSICKFMMRQTDVVSDDQTTISKKIFLKTEKKTIIPFIIFFLAVPKASLRTTGNGILSFALLRYQSSSSLSLLDPHQYHSSSPLASARASHNAARSSSSE